MKQYFYRGKIPNFGDELNSFLIPKVFPDFFDDDEAEVFLGIGSIIFDFHPEKSIKVVFGSGYGGYTTLPKFDETWRFYCVRGPYTAKACGLGVDKIGSDSAVLISKFWPALPRTIPISYMPHWESINRGHWKRACEIAGIHFIDPRDPVENVLDSLSRTQLLLTEAMHGAIVGDALRVPWIPIRPFHSRHRAKWFDWADPLDLKLSFQELHPSSLIETKMGLSITSTLLRRVVRKASMLTVNEFMAGLAAKSLLAAARAAPMLSSDMALSRAIDRLQDDAHRIRRDFVR